MTRKKKVASAAAAGGQPSARDPSPERVVERLKSLNCLLAKKTLERSGEIELLRSKLDDLDAGYSVLEGIESDVFRLVLSSQITDVAVCGSAELRRVEAYLAGEWDAAEGRTSSLQIKADLVAAKQRETEMRLLAVTREKERVETDLERAVLEKKLIRSDLDGKRTEMATLVESNRSLEQEHARISAALEVAEEKRGKLEEEGKWKEKILVATLHEKASLENCLEEKKQLVEKLVSDMEEMGRHKEAEIEVLNTENKAIAVKVSTFEKECRYLEDLKDQLQNEATHLMASLAELEKDNVELVASYGETEMRHVIVEEELKRFLNKLQVEKLELGLTLELKAGEMNLQMNELKENMAKMTAEKEALDQRNAEYKIEIGKLIQEKMELCSARMILEDAHSSFHEKIAIKDAECDTAQRHLKFLVKEVDALRLQIKELMKSKGMVELKHKILENKMNEATSENEKRRKHINSLISEKASLEKEFEMTLELKAGEINLQMNELKENMAKIMAEKEVLDQRNAAYEIEIGKLIQEKMELCSVRMILEDAHSSFHEKIAIKNAECDTAQTQLKFLVKEVDALRLQIKELMKSKDMVELKHKKLENKMNEATSENENWRKHINSLISEKASLEKEFEMTIELKAREMNSQMNELKENMARIKAEKEVLDQRNGECQIEIGKLIQEKMELCSDRMILEGEISSFNEKIAIKDAECDTAQRDLKFHANQVDALRLQIKELMKSKDLVELMHKKLENKMNEVTSENEKRRKHINSLISEKASLEKLLVSAQERLSAMASEMASVRSTLALLSKTTTEVNGQERAQGITSVETGVEMENDEALQPFVEEIKLALKSRESKIEEMEQELELLQLTVADAQKSSLGVWKWLCPTTTTIFAAVSLTYYVVARAR